ncbi:MAG: ABC transporter permease [Planctomycetia bacterium]
MNKTLVIASTTNLELIRRPLFWVVFMVVSGLLVLFDFIPYRTFGEDIKMVKDQGLAVIMIAGMVVGLFAASVAIADEIEGKTAITLLSKPITRLDFILGKYLGIMAAIALLFALLTFVFLAALYYKVGYDAKETAAEIPAFAERLKVLWRILPGVVLTYFQVAILTAVSVAFSTRFPLHINITACIIIFLLGHMAPLMVQTEGQFEAVKFMAQFFALVLPGLEYFNVAPAIATDADVPWLTYVLPCALYCLMYSAIALLLGLLMFEDRDLA